jgi:hypothetical protein
MLPGAAGLEPMVPGAAGLAPIVLGGLVAELGLEAELSEPLIGPEGEVVAPPLALVEPLGLVAVLEPIEPVLGLVALLEPIVLESPLAEPAAPAPAACANAAGANADTDNARPAPSKYILNRFIERIILLLGDFAATRMTANLPAWSVRSGRALAASKFAWSSVLKIPQLPRSHADVYRNPCASELFGAWSAVLCLLLAETEHSDRRKCELIAPFRASSWRSSIVSI